MEQYSKFKESLSNSTTNTAPTSVSDTPRDQVLDRARLLINKIKEHWHNKIKTKQQGKFEHLHYKRYRCHHNLNSHHQLFNHIDHNSNVLGRQPNVPSSCTPRPSTSSITSSVPATPWPPHLLPAQPPLNQPKQTQPAATLSAPIHVETTWTNGS